MDRRSVLAASAGLLASPALAQAPEQPLPVPRRLNLPLDQAMVIQLKDGPVVVRLRPDLAPRHVERIQTLARRRFYDNIVFHRVIEGFMAQTGDPQGTGMGGSDLPNVPAEFSREPFVRGVLGMARSQSPNSANSQFFIMFAEGSFLNGQYTVFGQVVAGMEAVDRIKRGDPRANGSVAQPQDRMIRVRVAPDLVLA